MAVSFQPGLNIIGVQTAQGRLEDHSNNFTLMRVIFALLVVLSHSYVIPSGFPLGSAHAQAFDFIAQRVLDGFFILSGYMLTAGLLRGQDLTGYAIARVLRIFPGMITVILLLFLIAGPLASSLPAGEYFTTPESWLFPVIVIAQINPQAGLPGLFEAHPFQSLNGPLWTIRYELYCYLAAGLLAALRLWRTPLGVWGLAGLAIAFSVVHAMVDYQGPLSGTIAAGARFGGAFLIGGAFYALRDLLGFKPVPALILALGAILLSSGPAGMIMGQIAIAYWVLWLGFTHIPGPLGARIRGVEDLSYGIYILHWPIGQLALWAWPGLSPVGLLVIMLGLSLPLAYGLRVFIEKPATASKTAVTGWIKARFGRLNGPQPFQPHA